VEKEENSDVKADGFSPDVREFLRLLDKHNVRYLIVGGRAVIYYGHPRMTGDIDIFYERTAANSRRLFKALEEFWNGDIPGISTPDELREEGMILQFGRPPNRIDLISELSAVKFLDAWPNRSTTSMDIRAQGIARSFAGILQHLNVDFAILGNKEPCCGDIARRVGEDGLFEKQMGDCREIFSRYHVHEVVTSSPHCFHTFINDYPAYQAVLPPDEQLDIRVRHYTMLLAEYVKAGILTFPQPLKVKATYHDPCYLGRHNGIFDQPREVIDAIPGVQRVEMAHTRSNSLCCGGGGDRVWQEDLDAEVKMAEIRIREAEAAGAEVLITACPLCLIMFEDIRKTAGLEQTIQVMDLNEFVVKALRLDTSSGNE
jgi:Fe-S oxidoreductase